MTAAHCGLRPPCGGRRPIFKHGRAHDARRLREPVPAGYGIATFDGCTDSPSETDGITKNCEAAASGPGSAAPASPAGLGLSVPLLATTASADATAAADLTGPTGLA